jgi:hypothetical protein
VRPNEKCVAGVDRAISIHIGAEVGGISCLAGAVACLHRGRVRLEEKTFWPRQARMHSVGPFAPSSPDQALGALTFARRLVRNDVHARLSNQMVHELTTRGMLPNRIAIAPCLVPKSIKPDMSANAAGIGTAP